MLLLFLLDLLILFTLAYLLITLCRLPTIAAAATGLLIALYGSIVLAGLIVAELGFLNNPYAHLVAHTFLLTLTFWVWNRAQRPKIDLDRPINFLKPQNLARTIRNYPELAVLTTGVSGLYLIGLYLILTLPYSSHDSMAYHLSRVGYWLQNNALRPYPTYEILQASFPVNSSLTMLWLVLFWGTDQLAGLLQWTAVLGSTAGIYGLARLIGGSRPQSFFAALLWPTFPVVILQSTTTLNDMTTAFLAVGTTYLFFLGLQENNRGSLLLSGAALGLAFGTKGTTFMFLPALGGVALFFFIKYRLKYLSRLAIWALGCAVGILLFGAYIYILNFITYTNPLGPHASGGTATVAEPTVETVVTNAARYLYQLADPTGLPLSVEAAIQPPLAQAGRQIFALLGLNENLPEATKTPPAAFTFDGTPVPVPGATEFGPPRRRTHEVMAWFGPLGFLLILPTVIYHLLIAPLKGQTNRWLLALMAVAYFLTLTYLMKWTPYRGRFMGMAVVVATPLLLVFFRPGWFGLILRWTIVSLALVVGFWSVTHNLAKPLLGPTTIWEVDPVRQQTFYGGQFDFVQAIHRYLPPDSTVGLVGYHMWDYPLFGPTFSRTVIPIYPYPQTLEKQELDTANIDYLVVSQKLGHQAPQLPDDYLPLIAGNSWQIFLPEQNFPAWFEWAVTTPSDPNELASSSLMTVAPPLAPTVEAKIQTSANRLKSLNGQPLLSIGPGAQQGLEGTIHTDRERLARLEFDALPGPTQLNSPVTIQLTLTHENGTITETHQFVQSVPISFDVSLAAGQNEFSFITLENGTNNQKLVDTPTLIVLRNLKLSSIIDKSQASIGPSQAPLATVSPALNGLVGIDSNARIPWPIEIDQQDSFLWLGPGEAGGLAGIFWSDASRSVTLVFDVAPGPGREDRQRTVQLASRHNDQVDIQTATFSEAIELSFSVILKTGRNDFQFIVLDEATIHRQPDGDTRPLLVRLNQVVIQPQQNSP